MKIIFFLILMNLSSTILLASPSYESSAVDAAPIVAYGKDGDGILRAIKTDTAGVVQVA